MSRYGSVTISGPASLITRMVQSADADDLTVLVNQAIAALPAGYVVVNLTLAGAGDGHTFTVTVEAGASANVTGGFVAPPSVTCFLASSAATMLSVRGSGPSSGTFADAQVAGAAKGTRFMGMVVNGVVIDGSGAADVPFSALKYVDVSTAVPALLQDGSDERPYATVQQAIDADTSGLIWVELVSVLNPSAITVPPNKLLSVVSGGVPGLIGAVTLGAGASASFRQCVVASLTTGASCVVGVIFGQVSGATVLGDSNIVELLDGLLSGPVSLGSNDLITGVGICGLGPVTLSAPGNTGGNIIMMGSVARSTGSATTIDRLQLDAIAAPSYGLAIDGYSLPQPITCFTMRASECAHLADLTTTSTDAAADTLHIESPVAIGAVTWTTAGRATVKGAETPAGMSIANAAGKQFIVDSYTNYWLKTNVVVLSSGVDKLVAADNVA